MSKAGDFIKKHRMGYDTVRLSAQMETYLAEMQSGLDGRGGSLLMLPSYLQPKSEVTREKTVICVDAGGTNLRIASARFDGRGRFCMDDVVKGGMPGVEGELTATEFFDRMAELLLPFCGHSRDIVLSFAYRAEATEEIDARIVNITKEVKVRGAEGRLLGAEMRAALQKKGVDGASVIVINDSVATTLAGKAEYLNAGYGAFTGTILGTGSNSCYLERIANIGKLRGFDGDGVMVVNTEAGSYDKMPRSDIDLAYDATTIHPGIGAAEKMTSGGYLGALCGFALRRAEEEGVLCAGAARGPGELQTADVSEYLADEGGIIGRCVTDEADARNAREILENVVKRAARMAALQMAAMAEKSCKTNQKICMTVEGSTYEKMHGLKAELHTVLLDYLGGRGYEADIISVENAVLKGCAIAGLSR